MGNSIKTNAILAIEVEDTASTYKAPTGASSFILPLTDGTEIVPAKEVLDRDVLNGSLFNEASRSGIKSVTAAIPVEFKAGDSGAAPEWGELLRGAVGSVSSTDEITSGSSHTTSIIYMADTDDLAKHDIVLIKESGAYHVSPISAVDTDASITLLIPMSEAPSDSVKIAKCNNYRTAASGHPSFSVTRYIEDAVRETAAGCNITSMSMENWTTGKQPTLNFGLEGSRFTRTLNAPAYTPSYDDSKPPVALCGKLYYNTTSIGCNELSLSLENTLGKETDFTDCYGIVSQRISKTSITGSLNPYKQDDSVTYFDAWEDDTEFSLFFYAFNPTNASGTEFNEVVAFYAPKCQFNEIGEADQDGLLQDTLAFKVNEDDDRTCVIMTA